MSIRDLNLEKCSFTVSPFLREDKSNPETWRVTKFIQKLLQNRGGSENRGYSVHDCDEFERTVISTLIFCGFGRIDRQDHTDYYHYRFDDLAAHELEAHLWKVLRKHLCDI